MRLAALLALILGCSGAAGDIDDQAAAMGGRSDWSPEAEMPTNITSTSTFSPDPIVAPADGDPRNAAGLVNPYRQLANRTLWLKNQLDDIQSMVTYLVTDTASNHPDNGSAITSTSFVNHSVAKLTLPNLVEGDRWLLQANIWVYHGSVSDVSWWRFGSASVGIEVSNSIAEASGVDFTNHTIQGVWTVGAGAPSSVDIYLQARVSPAGEVKLTAPVSLTATRFR